MTKAILKKIKSEVGATAIEYGLIVAAIGVALAVITFLIGDELVALLQPLVDFFTNI